MSRKTKKESSKVSIDSYPQPYGGAPMTSSYDYGMRPYGGGTGGSSGGSAFTYEPVPIKKRNRGALPVLMLILFILALAAGVAAYMLSDSVLTDEVKDSINVEERYQETISQLPEGTQLPEGVDMAMMIKITFAILVYVGVYSFFGLILGIWYLVAMCHISQEINLIAGDYDNKTTPFYCMAIFFSLLTLGLYGIVYQNNISARIGRELKRRSINYKFDEGTYWGWYFFGSLLFGLGPIIYLFKFFKAMKKLIADYNIYG